MSAATCKVAIVGASGYSGEELVRLVLAHPLAELTAVTSRQYAGKSLADVFPRFAGSEKAGSLKFIEPDCEALAEAANLVFLALPHGVAAEFAGPLLKLGCRVIDLSADFRLRSEEVYREFYGSPHPAPELLGKAVYGLPEVYRKEIAAAELVACPGCYPTSILLPTMPLLNAGLIHSDGIIADSLSGVSGAGRNVKPEYLFVECNESVRPYGVPKHRHLSEIEQELSAVAGHAVAIQFTPHLIPVNRGILTTLYFAPKKHFHEEHAASEIGREIKTIYQRSYRDEPFVRVLGSERLPDTKNVVGTNILELAWRLDARTGRLIVMSAEDNLIKGASGQAIQCFNLMYGFPETAGLG